MNDVENSLEKIRQKSLEINEIIKETRKIDENIKGVMTELDNLRFNLILKKGKRYKR